MVCKYEFTGSHIAPNGLEENLGGELETESRISGSAMESDVSVHRRLASKLYALFQLENKAMVAAMKNCRQLKNGTPVELRHPATWLFDGQARQFSHLFVCFHLEKEAVSKTETQEAVIDAYINVLNSQPGVEPLRKKAEIVTQLVPFGEDRVCFGSTWEKQEGVP